MGLGLLYLDMPLYRCSLNCIFISVLANKALFVRISKFSFRNVKFCTWNLHTSLNNMVPFTDLYIATEYIFVIL